MIKIWNLKLVIMLEYQNIQMLLQNVTLQTGLKTFLWLKSLKILFQGHILENYIIGEKLVGTFYENELQKII